VGRIRIWADSPFFSDHTPILLQFSPHSKQIIYPFKLNLSWLLEPDFTTIVKDVWSEPLFQHRLGIQQHFISKLKHLKICIKRWAVQRNNRSKQKLLELEHQIYTLHHSDPLTTLARYRLLHSKQLEADISKYMQKRIFGDKEAE
jgi:hypothetical protein